jgi:hypothetical protein
LSVRVLKIARKDAAGTFNGCMRDTDIGADSVKPL